jgi:hypothetical protein
VGIMPLRQTAHTTPKQRSGNKCGVFRTVSTLTGDDAEWLREMVDSNEDATWISRHLEKNFIWLSPGIIWRHRKRECKCWDVA